MSKNNKIRFNMQKLLTAVMASAFIIISMPSVSKAATPQRYSLDEKEHIYQMTVLKKNISSSALLKRLKYCAVSAGGGAAAGAGAGCAWGAMGGSVMLPGIGTIAGCVGGALLGGTAGGLGAGAIGCGYSFYDTWNWDKLSEMRELIHVETHACFFYDKSNGEKEIFCDGQNIVDENRFPIKKKITANIDFKPKFAFMSEDSESNNKLYEEEVGNIKLRNILIPVKIEIDKTVKMTVRKTGNGIVGDRIKTIPPDINGKEYFLFYIKNNPDLRQWIQLEFKALANNQEEVKAEFKITYENPIVERACDYPRELTFTNVL